MGRLRHNRFYLLTRKKRLKQVEHGVFILSAKRDALLDEYSKIKDETEKSGVELKRLMALCAGALMVAESYDRNEEVESASFASKTDRRFTIGHRFLFGIKIPEIEDEPDKRNLTQRGFGLYRNSPALEKAVLLFEELESKMRSHALLHEKSRLIGSALRATTRRVNALEQKMAPQIKKEIVSIGEWLEEQSAEDIYRTKRFKKLRERGEGEGLS